MGYAQLVIGPAGSGKSTYCSSLSQHCETMGRTINIVNLDPAAENFDYPVAMDIRELINLDEVMEELGLGPNGGLMYCMDAEGPLMMFSIKNMFSPRGYPEDDLVTKGIPLISMCRHLEDSLDDWLTEELDNYLDDDYLVFDCPGQIELFSHVPVLRNFVDHLKRKNFNVCAVYLLDSQFMTDVTKFISGCMASLSAMVQLELPHVNILSKMDLVTNRRDIEEWALFHLQFSITCILCVSRSDMLCTFPGLSFLNPEPQFLLSELNQRMAPQFSKLNKALIELVDQYSMVSFVPLDLRKESSIRYVLGQIDNCIQYGEDADVKIKDFDPEDDD
ncbi:hypothetical protein CJ030_MR1G007874 [Morella rubra]|uniref:GPN-loop GTPase 3 n=1 Tax=Morella rubra TaxID=262757 RepID=A0A6A1WNA9_9ROSI|nr:hypothetical protein CJ030_MR1G007874 [Morella rubra]